MDHQNLGWSLPNPSAGFKGALDMQDSHSSVSSENIWFHKPLHGSWHQPCINRADKGALVLPTLA